jgi:hypothetical protein
MQCNASYTRFIFGKFFISTNIRYAFLYAFLFAQNFYSCKKWVLQAEEGNGLWEHKEVVEGASGEGDEHRGVKVEHGEAASGSYGG